MVWMSIRVRKETCFSGILTRTRSAKRATSQSHNLTLSLPGFVQFCARRRNLPHSAGIPVRRSDGQGKLRSEQVRFGGWCCAARPDPSMAAVSLSIRECYARSQKSQLTAIPSRQHSHQCKILSNRIFSSQHFYWNETKGLLSSIFPSFFVQNKPLANHVPRREKGKCCRWALRQNCCDCCWPPRGAPCTVKKGEIRCLC